MLALRAELGECRRRVVVYIGVGNAARTTTTSGPFEGGGEVETKLTS
jgi:hypothetical protein